MPEKSRLGRRPLSRCRTPQLTASVGVPSTDHRFSPTRLARSGLCRVREWPAALRSWSGATVKTSPTGSRADASLSMPSEKTPSSLVTRMRGRVTKPRLLRRRIRKGHQECQDDVRKEPRKGGRQKRGNDVNDPDHGRIDLEIFGDTAADAGDYLVLPRACEAAGRCGRRR